MRLITAFLLLVLGSLMLSSNLMAADIAVKTPSLAPAAQQKRITDCNHQASTKSLKGENCSTFMSTCLKKSA